MSAVVPNAIGGYRIVATLGRGGTGSVYRGERDGATFAIKCLHDFVREDPELRARFVREGRLTARVRHPNLVHVCELAEDAAVGPYLVMEELRGVTLAQLLGAGVPLPLPVAVFVLRSVLTALAALHDLPAGAIVHGDLSPQNVMVGFDGSVKLIDLGLARADHATRVTRSETLRGKLRYLAPEQLEAAPRPSLDTDQYAAAVVMWETLPGKPLIGGKDNNVRIARILAGHHSPPSTTRADVPNAVDAIVLRGLSRHSADRWESVRAMHDAFAASTINGDAAGLGAWVRETLPVAAAEALDTEALERPPRRVARALVLAVAVLGLGAFAWPRQPLWRVDAVVRGPASAVTAASELPELPEPETPAPVRSVAAPARPEAAASARRGPPRAASSCARSFSFDPMGNKTYRPGCL